MIRNDYAFSARGAMLLIASCVLFPAYARQSPATEEKPLLTVRGITEKPVTLQKTDFDKLPHKSVKVHDKGGQEMTYEGVPLRDVLKRAGMDFEANLHGRALTKYLLVEAVDKYRAVFALPEFDPDFTDKLVLVATTRDGKPLSPEEGPLRLIVPDEKRQARWVRQIRLLTLADAVAPAERNQKP